MHYLSGSDQPWLRRLDHLICEVPDIEESLTLFVSLGFPIAWPIGRFWPQGLTAGVALGGINLEFLQPDSGAPEIAQIRTLAFEPTNLETSIAALADAGCPTRVAEKWEDDPDLLRLRGFGDEECNRPQLICRNAIPTKPTPIHFFLCDYAPQLKARLAPKSFPSLPQVTQVVVSIIQAERDWPTIDRLFGLPIDDGGVEICLSALANDRSEVVEIVTDRGPIDLGKWRSRFQFA